MLKKFAMQFNRISKYLGDITALIILPLIGLIIYAACKRYFFDSMPSWGYEIPIFIYGMFFLVGGIYCQLNNKHVNVDILPKYVSLKWQTRLQTLSNLLIAGGCLVVAYYASGWAYESMLINERSVHQTDFNPTIWWFKLFVPFSFFFVAIQSIVNIVLPLTKDSLPSKEEN
ncbi:MAG: TRAP transporter small permease [Cloacibacillus sp.]